MYAFGPVEIACMANEIPVERFAASFQQFMEHISALAPTEEEPVPRAGDRITAFLGAAPSELSIAKCSFRMRDLPTVQRSVEALLEKPGWSAQLLGYTVEHDMGFGMSTILAPRPYDPVRIGAPVYQTVEVPAGRISCLEQGLYLMNSPAGPIALLQHVDRGYREARVRVEAAAPSAEAAQLVLDRVQQLAKEQDVLKGSVISLGADGAEDVSFHPRMPVHREDVILPETVLDSIERPTITFSEHAGALLQAGRHLKRGLLFHGPPGTGKSLAVRYLMSALPERTVIVLSGRVLGLIKLSCELARELAPSIVVLEDVDLVAEDRTREPQCGPLLFELMNEMDGLPGDADIIFLLTTNRPEALEPALASRPGRIDQAIEFPLPDAECRRRLFELYGRGIEVRSADLEEMVSRTEGASPAFIKEVLRRTALNAAIRGRSGDVPAVSIADFRAALEEILVVGGELSARLLGAASRSTS
jgi:hypothetical protein